MRVRTIRDLKEKAKQSFRAECICRAEIDCLWCSDASVIASDAKVKSHNRGCQNSVRMTNQQYHRNLGIDWPQADTKKGVLRSTLYYAFYDTSELVSTSCEELLATELGTKNHRISAYLRKCVQNSDNPCWSKSY